MTAYTPIYNLPYVETSDLVASYPTVSEELAENVETAIAGSGGLSLISPTSIANSGGSASSADGTTTFTGVSSISLNGIFTATYQNYRMILNVTAASTNITLGLRWRTAGTDASGASDYVRVFYGYSSGAQAQDATNSSSSAQVGLTNAGDGGIYIHDIAYPNAARKTFMLGQESGTSGTTYFGITYANFHTLSTAYDGLSIITSTGNITGKIRVYGYKGA